MSLYTSSHLAYIYTEMFRLSNRRAIVIAMCLKLAYFIITYPWPIYEKTIAYEVTSRKSHNSFNLLILQLIFK